MIILDYSVNAWVNHLYYQSASSTSRHLYSKHIFFCCRRWREIMLPDASMSYAFHVLWMRLMLQWPLRYRPRDYQHLSCWAGQIANSGKFRPVVVVVTCIPAARTTLFLLQIETFFIVPLGLSATNPFSGWWFLKVPTYTLNDFRCLALSGQQIRVVAAAVVVNSTHFTHHSPILIIQGAKSLKFGLDFRAQSPMKSFGFQVEQLSSLRTENLRKLAFGA